MKKVKKVCFAMSFIVLIPLKAVFGSLYYLVTHMSDEDKIVQSVGSVNTVFTKDNKVSIESILVPPAVVEGKADADNLTVSKDRSSINPFTVKLYEPGDSVTYRFEVRNTSKRTICLESVSIASSYLISTARDNNPTGLRYSLNILDSYGDLDVFSADGTAVPNYTSTGDSNGASYIEAAPNETVYFTLQIDAESDALFYSSDKAVSCVELTMGQITFNWSEQPTIFQGLLKLYWTVKFPTYPIKSVKTAVSVA